MRPPRLACLRKLNWGNSACALLLLCVTTAIALPAQTVTTLHSFDSTDGQLPELLVQATNGNLYATTAEAGANGYGTVFKIAPGGTFTLLDSFDATVGEYPYGAPLVQDANGDFYGTLQAGGADLTLCGGSGCGTFFKMTLAGDLTTLYSFCSHSNCTDGTAPLTGLVLGTDGNFYGTTSAGGANCVTDGGCGTVFKITPGGALTTLYSFCSKSDCTDGEFPTSWLIQAPGGVFYGTTFSGGSNCVVDGGCGTVFKITPNGTLTTLYSFCAQSNCTDGSNPRALIQAANGDSYGTTKLGGANNDGTIFKITPGGKPVTVYSFDSTGSGSLSLQATDGNFYGTTHTGGANNAGAVFKMTPGGTVTTVYSFCAQSGCTDGSAPVGLLQDTNGKFYGSTEAGGTSSACTGGCGTTYSLSVGLKPFVETQTTSGKEGAKIGILGQGFSSSSIVKFGGTKATAIVLSGATFITATVPAAALTGSVTVTTAATTLISSQIFKVTPTMTSFAPPSGPVGTTVTIRGTGLKQTTEVTFNGKSATITPDSDTQLTADVPSGATTGKIVVTTKGGSATSATSFTVN